MLRTGVAGGDWWLSIQCIKGEEFLQSTDNMVLFAYVSTPQYSNSPEAVVTYMRGWADLHRSRSFAAERYASAQGIESDLIIGVGDDAILREHAAAAVAAAARSLFHIVQSGECTVQTNVGDIEADLGYAESNFRELDQATLDAAQRYEARKGDSSEYPDPA